MGECPPGYVPCPQCGGSGFSSQGTGYGDVCGECGGQQYVSKEQAKEFEEMMEKRR